jgi:hypothetical protein
MFGVELPGRAPGVIGDRFDTASGKGAEGTEAV